MKRFKELNKVMKRKSLSKVLNAVIKEVAFTKSCAGRNTYTSTCSADCLQCSWSEVNIDGTHSCKVSPSCPDVAPPHPGGNNFSLANQFSIKARTTLFIYERKTI